MNMSETVSLPGDFIEAQVVDLPTLASVANRWHADAQDAHRGMVECAIHSGRALIEAKKLCRQGTWMAWVKDNFEGSHDLANKYMKLAENSERVMNSDRHTSLREALKAVTVVSGWCRAIEPGDRLGGEQSTASEPSTDEGDAADEDELGAEADALRWAHAEDAVDLDGPDTDTTGATPTPPAPTPPIIDYGNGFGRLDGFEVGFGPSFNPDAPGENIYLLPLQKSDAQLQDEYLNTYAHAVATLAHAVEFLITLSFSDKRFQATREVIEREHSAELRDIARKLVKVVEKKINAAADTGIAVLGSDGARNGEPLADTDPVNAVVRGIA